jgi:hypothetical protein
VQSPARTAQAISVLALNYSRVKKRMMGIVKLNLDAGMGSTGAIIRDDPRSIAGG